MALKYIMEPLNAATVKQSEIKRKDLIKTLERRKSKKRLDLEEFIQICKDLEIITTLESL